jgi:hypothetical protein
VTGGRSSCSLSMVAAFSFIFIHFSFIFHPFFSHFPHFFSIWRWSVTGIGTPKPLVPSHDCDVAPKLWQSCGRAKKWVEMKVPGILQQCGNQSHQQEIITFFCARDDADFLMKPFINGNFLHRGPRCPSGPRIFGPRVGPGIRMADNECRRVALPHRPWGASHEDEWGIKGLLNMTNTTGWIR